MGRSRRKAEAFVIGSPQCERLMANLFIRYDGRRYQYNGYHYDELADAVNYAKLTGSCLRQMDFSDPEFVVTVNSPSDADRQLMAALGIEFENGVYRFQGYRYERFADAANYARLQARRRGIAEAASVADSA
jgi:hypothetical protein